MPHLATPEHLITGLFRELNTNHRNLQRLYWKFLNFSSCKHKPWELESIKRTTRFHPNFDLPTSANATKQTQIESKTIQTNTNIHLERERINRWSINEPKPDSSAMERHEPPESSAGYTGSKGPPYTRVKTEEPPRFSFSQEREERESTIPLSSVYFIGVPKIPLLLHFILCEIAIKKNLIVVTKTNILKRQL